MVRESLRRADLLVLTGGLGPTADDVTREAVSDALGLPLDEDADIVERIRQRFARRGMEMPAVNRVQAQVLQGRRGAPECQRHRAGAVDRARVAGRPAAARAAARDASDARAPFWPSGSTPRASGARLYRRVLKIAGRTESDVEQVTQPVYSRFAAWQPPVATSILAAPGQIELHFSVRAESAERGGAILDRATSEILAVVGDDVFSTDGRSLEQVVGDLLRAPRLADGDGGVVHRRASSPRASPTFPGVPTTSSAVSWPTATAPRPSCSACRRT